MSYSVKVLIFVVGWGVLFALIRPLALLALILFPIVWLVSLPLRFVLQVLLVLVRVAGFLPARLPGIRKCNA